MRPGGHRRPIIKTTVAVAVLIGAASLVSGCSSTPPASTSAPLPATNGAATQRALLTARQVSALAAAPLGVRVVPNQKGTLYRDPDPRSPCGATVRLPDLSHSAHVTFDAASFGAFQVVVDEPPRRAAAFVTAWQRDTRPGCPPVTSRTSAGSTQLSALVEPIAMPTLVDQATGAFMTVQDAGHTVDTYAMVMRWRGRLELDVLISRVPLAAVFVIGLARAAEADLKGSFGSSS